MSVSDEQVRDLIAQQAADWFVANRTELAPRERAAFAEWLRASPVHVEEYLAVAATSRDLKDACADSEAIDTLIARARAAPDEPMPIRPRAVETARGARGPRWHAAALACAALAALSLGLLAWWHLKVTPSGHLPIRAETFRFETRHGEQQTHPLPDGSIVHLNTDTEVSVTLSGSERLATLSSGEADFEVAHESLRPFRVLAGAAQVVDLGTQFDVRLNTGVTLITVVAGRVVVGPAALPPPAAATVGGDSGFVEVRADQQIRLVQGLWPAAPVASDAHRETSWLRRQISFEHEPLARVATEFNRYASKPIEITTPELKDLEISGVFAIDDTEAFIAFLRSLEGVRVEVTATRILVSRD